MSAERLDTYLVSMDYFSSREKAKYEIKRGNVLVNGVTVNKPSLMVYAEDQITITDLTLKYVSKGGLKLEKAIDVFNIDFNNKVVCDIGSSTGGFVDCALKHGAKHVYAIDVGSDQLVDSLRNSNQVTVLENTHFKDIRRDHFSNGIPQLITIDVSFISLEPIIKHLNELVDGVDVIALVKPQFEAGKSSIGKHGVVKDAKIHMNVVDKVIQFSNMNQFYTHHLDYSPITGAKGNIEFLIHLKRNLNNQKLDIKQIILNAHEYFKKSR